MKPHVTYKYTANGPQGFLENKKAIHIHGCGGIYSDGSQQEFGDSYIQFIFKLAGVELLPTIWVERRF